MVLVAAVVAGLMRPRLGGHAWRPPVRHLPLLGVGALLNAASFFLSGRAAPIALAASLAVLIAVTVVNRHLTGLAVVGVGLGLNLASVAINEGMPVRPSALVRAGAVAEDDVATTSFRGARHLESDRDALGVLGDVLPLPLTREVMSFGDLIVIVGAADAARELSRRRARRGSRADREAYVESMAMTNARVDHVWGTAPSARPVLGSQYSANPVATAPLTIERAKVRASVASSELVAASHSR